MAKKFDLSTYLRNQPGAYGGPARGTWGIPDPAGTARGRLAQFRRGLAGISVARTPTERWAMQSKPGFEAQGIQAGVQKVSADLLARQRKYQQRQIKNQATRAAALAEMNPAARNKYTIGMERRRLNAIASVENKTGWSMEDIMAYRSGEGKHYQMDVRENQYLTPAELASQEKVLSQKFKIADETIWQMALLNARSEFTEIGSLAGVEYNESGQPILDTTEKEQEYLAAIKTAGEDPSSKAVEKYGLLQSHYFAWKMANKEEDWTAPQDIIGLGVSTRTPEGQATIASYRNAITNLLEWNGVPSNIVNMALSTRSPLPPSHLIDFGFFKVGHYYSSDYFRMYGWDVPPDFAGGVFSAPGTVNWKLKEAGDTAPITEPEALADMEEHGVPVIGIQPATPTPTPAEGETGWVTTNAENFRNRDWSVNQVLSADEVETYFDIDGDIAENSTFTVSKQGDTYTIVSQTIDGWSFEFNEDGTVRYTSPDGISMNQGELDSYENTLLQQRADALRQGEWGGIWSTIINSNKVRDNDTPASLEYKDGKEYVIQDVTRAVTSLARGHEHITGPTLVPTGNPDPYFKAGQLVLHLTPFVLSSTPSHMSADDFETDDKGNTVLKYWTFGPTEENPSAQIGQWQTITIPDLNNILDPAELPGFIVNTPEGYYLDVSNPDGFVFLRDTYPMVFLNLMQKAGPESPITDYLTNNLHWSDEQQKAFFTKPVEVGGTPWWQDMNTPWGATAQFFLTGIKGIGIGVGGVFSGGDWMLEETLERIGVDPVDMQMWKDSIYLGLAMTGAGVTTIPATGNKIIDTAGRMLGTVAEADRFPTELETPTLARLATKAGMPSRVIYGAQKLPIIGRAMTDPLSKVFPRSSSFSGALARGYISYNVASDILSLAAGGLEDLGKDNYEDRIFWKRIGGLIQSQGIMAFFNNSFIDALKGRDDVPGWMTNSIEAISMMAPLGIPRVQPKLPMMFRSVRKGNWEFVKHIDSPETLRAAASYNNYKLEPYFEPRFMSDMYTEPAEITAGQVPDRWILEREGQVIQLNNFKEADLFFKTGNKYGYNILPMEWLNDTKGKTFNLWKDGRVTQGLKAFDVNDALQMFKDKFKYFYKIRESEFYKEGDLDAILRSAEDCIKRGEFKPEDLAHFSHIVQESIKQCGFATHRFFVDHINSNLHFPMRSMKVRDGKFVRGIKRFRDGMPTVKNEAGEMVPSTATNDVMTYWRYVIFDNPRMEDYCRTVEEYINAMSALAKTHGKQFGRAQFVDLLREGHYFPRSVTGVKGMEKLRLIGSNWDERSYELMMDGLEDGFVYASPEDALAGYVRGVYNFIAKDERNKVLDIWIKSSMSETLKGQILITSAEIAKKYSAKAGGLVERIKNIQASPVILNKRGYRTWLKKNGFENELKEIEEITGLQKEAVDLLKLNELIDRFKLGRRLLPKDWRQLRIDFPDDYELLKELLRTTKNYKSSILREKLEARQAVLKEINKQLYSPEDIQGLAPEAISSIVKDMRGRIVDVLKYNKPVNEAMKGLPKQSRGAYRDLIRALEEYEGKKVANGIGVVSGLKVYHGTQEGLPGKIKGAMYFTDSYGEAAAYAGADFDRNFTNIRNIKGDVGEYYITLHNPQVLDVHDKYFTRASKYSSDKIAELKAQGYDGVVMPSESYGVGKNYIVFDETYVSKIKPVEDIDKLVDDFLTRNFSGLKEVSFELNKEAIDLMDNLIERVMAAQEEAKSFLKERVGARAKYRTEMAEVQEQKGEASGIYIKGFHNEIFEPITYNGKVISGQEIRDLIKKEFDPHINKWLEKIYKPTRAVVTAKATMDDSAPLTFGWYLLGEDFVNLMKLQPSAAWLKATGISFEELFSTRGLGWYRNRNLPWYEYYLPYGLKVAEESNDYFAGLGFMKNWVDKSPLISKHPVIGDVFHTVETKGLSPVVRANRAFSAFSEVGRIELIKAHERTWLSYGGTKLGLVEFADLCTSTLPRTEVNTNINRTYAQGIMFFAPNYLWSNFLFLGRMMRPGGITGRELRKTFAGAWAAWTAIYLSLWYGTQQEGDPHIFPWDPDFFTFKLDDRIIGIPGFNVAFTRSMFSIFVKAIENPDKLFTLKDQSARDLVNNWLTTLSPSYRFISYKESPTMEIIRQVITGRDVMNKRVDTPIEYLRNAGLMFLPISIENFIIEDKPHTIASSAAIFFGARERPMSAYEELEEAGNKYVQTMDPELLDNELWAKQQDGTLTWWDLGVLREVVLAENPELAALQAAADAERLEYKPDRYIDWHNKYALMQQEDKEWYDNALKNVRDGLWTWKDYNDSRKNHINNMAGRRDQIESDFKDLYDQFDKWKADGEDITANFERAYDEYYETVYGLDTETNTGDVLWDVREAKIAEWKSKWGEQYYNMLQEVIETGFKDDDPVLKFMWDLDKTTDEYYKVPEGKDRIDFRRNPDNLLVEAALIFRGKVSTMENPEAEEIVREWCEEYGLNPDTAIPTLKNLLIPDEMMTKYPIESKDCMKEYEALDVKGWSRERYLIEHPGFLEYWTKELGHSATDEYGRQIYTWDRVPTAQEETLINMYITAVGDATTRTKKIWRCQHPEADAALARINYNGITSRMEADWCEANLPVQSGEAEASGFRY